MSQPAEVLESGSTLRGEQPGGSQARHAQAGTKRLISGASLVLGGMLVGQASNFAFNAVGAHALGPAHYGTLAASMALISFATPLLAAIQAVASREATSLAARNELRKLRPMLRHYGLRVTCGALALGAAIAAASSWISGLFHLGSPWFVVIVGVAIPCYIGEPPARRRSARHRAFRPLCAGRVSSRGRPKRSSACWRWGCCGGPRFPAWRPSQ